MLAEFEAPALSDWGDGYCTELSVTNIGTDPVTNWAVTFDMNGTFAFTTWNGTFSATSGVGTVQPESWALPLDPGETDTSVGLCGGRPPGNTTALPTVVSVSN